MPEEESALQVEMVYQAKELLEALKRAKESSEFLVVHLLWGGCRLGCDPDSASELDEFLNKIRPEYKFFQIDIPWRLGTQEEVEPGKYVTLFDYREPQTEAYLVFRELAQCKLQQNAGFAPIESYSVPPWDRPHFPQVLIIDTREIDSTMLAELDQAASEDGLEDEDDLGPVTRKLISDSGEVILTLERLLPGSNPKDPASYKVDDWVRHRLRNLVSARGWRLQLLNEHLFRISDQLLQEDKAEESVYCVIRGSGPRNCIAYQRGPITSGCGVSKGTTHLN